MLVRCPTGDIYLQFLQDELLGLSDGRATVYGYSVWFIFNIPAVVSGQQLTVWPVFVWYLWLGSTSNVLKIR
jgi:hypothetical protein